jgi:hypothetical protein
MGREDEAGNVARPQIEHPLNRVDGIFVVAEFGIGLGQVAVDGDVIGSLAIEPGCDLAGLGKFVAAQQQERLDLETFVIIGRAGEGLLQGLFRPVAATAGRSENRAAIIRFFIFVLL